MSKPILIKDSSEEQRKRKSDMDLPESNEIGKDGSYKR
jgi:hypothetical protein